MPSQKALLFSMMRYPAYACNIHNDLTSKLDDHHKCYSRIYLTSAHFPVAMRSGDTPVPIPNTMVKTMAADGTMLETAWESRWMPD